MKTPLSIASALISSSPMPITDPKQLFANLLKVQYPMSQDEPSAKPEPKQETKAAYQARMEELMEKHADSW